MNLSVQPQETGQGHDWGELLSSLYDDVFRLALKLCRSKVLAEDLAQETFLRACRFQHTLRDADATKAWLFTILRNENSRRFERRECEWEDIEQLVAAGARSHEPDWRAESHLLRRAIAELGADYREPLVLQVFGGYTGREIAVRLNLNSNTVTTRLFRAKAQLGRKFERKSGRKPENKPG